MSDTARGLVSSLEGDGQELPAGTPLVQCGARGRAWRVAEGRVDVFLARRELDGSFAERIPLVRVEAEGFVFDLPVVSCGRGEFVPVFVPGPGARCTAFNAVKLAATLDVAGQEELLRALVAYAGAIAGSAPAADDVPGAFDQAWTTWRNALLALVQREGGARAAVPSAPLTEFEIKSLYRGVIKRAVTDAAFRRLLAADPRAAATRVLGRPLPDDFTLRVEFERPDETVVVL